MFRTARGFLLVAPAAFTLALFSFLVFHPRAAGAFGAYPFMTDALGHGFGRRPLVRFTVTAFLFFLLPYLTGGLLLFLADLGAAVAWPLWRTAPRQGPRPPRGGGSKKASGVRRSSAQTLPDIPHECVLAFLVTAGGVAAVGGGLLHRVAHGGELPGGVNVAPLFVAGVPFAALLAGLLVAGAAALPRLLLERLSRA